VTHWQLRARFGFIKPYMAYTASDQGPTLTFSHDRVTIAVAPSIALGLTSVCITITFLQEYAVRELVTLNLQTFFIHTRL